MHTTNGQLTKLEQTSAVCLDKVHLHKINVTKLILENQELAVKMAFSMLSKWRFQLPKPEVQSTASLALCEAANRFDSDRGVNFGTFLFSYVRGHLLKEITASYNRKQRFVLVEDNCEAEKCSIREEKSVCPEAIVGQGELLSLLHQAKLKLTELEARILERCFGDDMTVVDVAKELGYSRGHVSRMKSDALELLAEAFSETAEEIRAAA